MRVLRFIVLVLALLSWVPAVAAQDARNTSVLRLLPLDAASDKQITVGGRTIAYAATAGTLSLFDQNGDRSAAVFYTAYVAKDAQAASRPVTFVFNGGPGAASTYLHLGLAGPRIVDFGPDGRDGAAARMIDNPDSWLAFTDLVFIDPVGTGWSRAAKPDGGGAYWGVQRDADTFAKVIALYVAKNSRSASPKYLLGESYGGFRAAKVARELQNDQGIVVSGIIMVSPMLEASLQWGGESALRAALHFPALVATELERTKTFTPEAVAEAERFATTEYLTTLAGAPPAGEEADRFYRRIARMTGLSAEAVAKARGYVRGLYLQHLRAGGQVVSAYDGSFALPDPYPESASGRGSDPMLDGFTRALSGAFVGYARDELGFKTEMTYILLGNEVSSKWDWGDRRSPPGVSDDIRHLLALNPSFRLLIAHGYTDLVTPYGVSRYVLHQIPDIGGAGRTQLKLYRGGHMYYFSAESRRSFSADARNFIQGGP
jgi:carboxypeptidase C (cathepsin A)